MSNPKAQAAKEKGNQAFKAADYPTAIGHYTSAILADKSDPAFYLNRAAAYLKLGKFEDAERDCTTVLSLPKNANNVKALFRRGQARVGLGRPLEAEQDFSHVLRIEPSNTSAQDELKNVKALIQQEKAKKAKAPISPVQSSLSPETTTGKRRRVPIRVVDGDGRPVSVSAPSSSAVPPAPVATTAPTSAGATKKEKEKAVPPPAEPMDVDVDVSTAGTTPAAAAGAAKPQAEVQARPQPPKPKASSPDTLEAVSSRSLKTASASASPAPAPKPSPSAPSAPAPTSAPPFTSPPPPKASPAPAPAPAQSFKQAKEARQSRVAVGGGIFKKNGESVVFPPRGGNAKDTDTSQAAVAAGEAAMDVDANGPANTGTSPVPTQPFAGLNLNTNGPQSKVAKPPSTLFEFSRLWDSVPDREGARGVEERWRLINTIPPSQFPALCKTSLEPTLLVSIFEVFLAVLRSLSTSPSQPSQPSQAPHDQNQALAQAQAQEIKTRIREYLDAFTLIPRFSTLLLFLSKREKEVVRGVWGLLGVDGEGDGEGLKQGVWKAVAV